MAYRDLAAVAVVLASRCSVGAGAFFVEGFVTARLKKEVSGNVVGTGQVPGSGEKKVNNQES